MKSSEGAAPYDPGAEKYIGEIRDKIALERGADARQIISDLLQEVSAALKNPAIPHDDKNEKILLAKLEHAHFLESKLKPNSPEIFELIKDLQKRVLQTFEKSPY